ncbi:MAG: hypothetical protein Q8K70_02970 [Bacteroidota bacterium]|nr:hypothetical protein [Bacteroidota bacterium]
MKKLLLKAPAVFAFALCCVFLSCNKNQCEPCGSNYKAIPQEMKDWALFGEGSWWVYRLAEDTTVFDTVRFSSRSDFRSNLTTCDDNSAPSIGCSETITYHLKHSNKNYFANPFNSNLTVYDEINLYYPNGGGVFLRYNNGAAPGTSGVIFGIAPIKMGEHYGNFSLIDTLNNFKFNGFLVQQAFNSQIITTNPPIPKSFDKVFWGKNIGLLKIQLTHANGETKTWELINYDVKQ